MDSLDRRQFLRKSLVGASLTLFSTGPAAAFTGEPGAPKRGGGTTITRRLGKTDIVLPVVSMGVMRADNPALVRAALDAGVKHLDTAHSYQQGNNEKMLGEVLKEHRRDSFVISTKIPSDAGDEFMAFLDLSLARLQMKYVDILYVHGLSSADDVMSERTLAALRSAKESGKARYLGVSTHKNEPEVIGAAAGSGIYDVVLTSINFKQDHFADVSKAIADAAAAGVGIIAMKTMAGGFHDKERKKPVNCTAALKWVLQNPNVTTAIPGITTFDQLAENVALNSDLTMTADEKSSLLPGKSEGGLYCPGCHGCAERCAKRLPVPDLMRAYMYTYGYRDPRLGRDLLSGLGVAANACGDCDACSVHCARGFDVRGRIQDIVRLADVPSDFLL